MPFPRILVALSVTKNFNKAVAGAVRHVSPLLVTSIIPELTVCVCRAMHDHASAVIPRQAFAVWNPSEQLTTAAYPTNQKNRDSFCTASIDKPIFPVLWDGSRAVEKRGERNKTGDSNRCAAR